MRNIVFARLGSPRATAIRWSIGLAVLAVCVCVHAAVPSFGGALEQWLAVRSARYASSYLEVAGVQHLLLHSEVLLPRHRFQALELQQHFTSWICVLGFAVAFIIVAKRRLTRSILLLGSLPALCILVGAATVFAAVQLSDRSLLALESTSTLLAHTLFFLLVILAFDQLLGVLWFAGKFCGFVAVRVIGVLIGAVVLAFAQLWRLSSSKRASRRKSGWTNRARAMLRGPRLDRFLRDRENRQLFEMFRSRSGKRKKGESDTATPTAQTEPVEDVVADTKQTKRGRKRLRFLPRGWTSTLRKHPSLRLPLALPAVVLLAASGFGQLRWSQLVRGELIPRYQHAASIAFSQRDDEAANLYYRKLQQLDKSNEEAIYGRALVAQRIGKKARATELMESIAPQEQPGYPAAHLWLAKSISEGRPGLDAPAETSYRLHLTRAVEGGAGDSEAEALLGLLMQSKGRHEQAVRYLTAAVNDRPDLWLNLAGSYAARRMHDQAKWAAEEAIAYYARVSSEEPVSEHRIRWSQALIFLAQFEQAEAVLTEGLAGASGYQFHTALVGTYVSWFDFLSMQSNRDEALLLTIGGKGLKIAPDHGPLLQRVGALVYFGELPADERPELPEIHTQVAASPEALLVLGSEFTRRNQYREAAVLLELALQLRPQAAEIKNNLAWALLRLNRDLERALQLATEAVNQRPGNAHLRDTRGQILVRLGRYRAALADLEHALALLGRNPRLHRALATAYENLGMPELSDKHKRLAVPPGD